ncbi:hypothetical protein B0H14DRAFT_2593000 [Mycena olivaceomarginata]|nr:hypothetical protein B0H14DRAFT_2593000 [Mycena olivaceomarginata]
MHGNSLCSFAFLAPLCLPFLHTTTVTACIVSKVKDTSTGLLEWLRNTSWEKGLATLGRSAISAAGVLKLVFEAVVELNRERVKSNSEHSKQDTIPQGVRENREWPMIASGIALFILGFEELGIRAARSFGNTRLKDVLDRDEARQLSDCGGRVRAE